MLRGDVCDSIISSSANKDRNRTKEEEERKRGQGAVGSSSGAGWKAVMRKATLSKQQTRKESSGEMGM